MRLLFFFASLALVFLMAGCNGGRAEKKKAADGFARFVDLHFRSVFEWSPSAGTEAGFHEYDSKTEDYSAVAIRTRIATLSEELLRLSDIRKGPLSADDEIDAAILNGQLRSDLLDLETLHWLNRNPIPYVSTPGGSVDSLIKRNFAPPAERLRNVIVRLQGVPPLIKAMMSNMEDPPREYTELAIRVANGSVGFFDKTVRNWGEEAAGNDAGLKRDLNDAAEKAANAMRSAAAWLQKELLARSKGSFAIGAENFSRKLLYDEMLEIPLDRLLEIGEANLEKDHRAFLDTAQRIAPGKLPMEVMRMLSSDHPTEARLIEDTKRNVEAIRQFLVDHKIVSVPSEVRPIITETPPYARAGGFAMMETPGAYETKATEAFYYVTPPEKQWPAKQKEEYLRAFNRPVMEMITIHEAWPGHFLQFLYARQFPSKTRKLTYCSTNVEGWAHYSEQMMVEEGFGNGDPKIKLAQLSEALLRDCRYVVGIRLHTKGMTVEEGTRLFIDKGFSERQVALEETWRGAYDPTYLYYTLGKLMICKMREDYRKAKGSAYSLEGFHDEFVRQGGLPIPLMRRIMLPGDTSPLL
jgi:uncharacterized protein (DUF885 family)